MKILIIIWSKFMVSKGRKFIHLIQVLLFSLLIKGCDFLCPYEDFLRIIREKYVENYPDLCAGKYILI
jgi:hypothetical protein